MDIKIFVEDLDIPAGETRRLNCPVCRSYKTFTATNNMGSLLWNCYKASCSVGGTARVKLTLNDLRNMNKPNSVTEPFVLPEYVVSRDSDVSEWASELYGLNAEELGLLYDVKDHRVVFPIVHDNKIVDAAGRAMGKKLPKWKRYGNNSLPYVSGSGTVAVVVEDCVSAAVVGGYGSFVGVALLGTSLSEAHKGYLTQFSTAIMALDPDALPKTLQFAKELRGYVNDVKVLRLHDDIKYRTRQDVDKLLAFR